MTRSLSSPSLYKAGFITFQSEEKKVIDSNDKFAKRLQELQEVIKETPKELVAKGISKDLEPASVARLLDEDIETEGEEFEEGLSAPEVSIAEVYNGPSPEELIQQAKEEAEAILEQAKVQAEEMRKQAVVQGVEEGRQAGYEEAMTQAQAEISKREQELLDKEELLEKTYQNKILELEPQLVDILTGIYEHIFKVNLKDDKGMIVHLLEVSINRVGAGRDFIIHVSREDYPVVSAKKDEILKFCASENSTIEVIEDMTLSSSECMIETEGGIFDCSLGVQLEELSKQLRMLSYERN